MTGIGLLEDAVAIQVHGLASGQVDSVKVAHNLGDDTGIVVDLPGLVTSRREVPTMAPFGPRADLTPFDWMTRRMHTGDIRNIVQDLHAMYR